MGHYTATVFGAFFLRFNFKNKICKKNGKRAVFRSGTTALFLCAVLSLGTLTSSKTFADDCKDLLEVEDELDQDIAHQVALEEHSLLDLVSKDPAKNLAALHPSLLMNANQVFLSILYHFGTTHVVDPDPLAPAEEVEVYKALSIGIPEVKNRMIVGRLKAIRELLSYVKAAAAGDRTGVSVPLLVGGPGTGKTELLSVIRLLLRYATTHLPEQYMYYVHFENLHEIAAVREVIPSYENGMSQLEYACIYDSPFAVLPEAYRESLVASYGAAASKLAKEQATPESGLSPDCAFIHDEILKHYARTTNSGKPLSSKQKIEVLNKHVKIRRIVLGTDNSAPYISAQGKLDDFRGLFIAPNPYVTNLKDQSHPMAHRYSGKVLRARRNVLFLDELLAQPEKFLRSFLHLFESREAEMDGAPTVPFDAVILAASNSAFLRKAENDPLLEPIVDRLKPIDMNATPYPYEIATLLLLGKQSKLVARQLGIAPEAAKAGEALVAQEPKQVPIRDLFPWPTGKHPHVGPDGRYNLWIGSGPKKVHISPHAILFIARVVAASRMNFDFRQAMEAAPNYSVINTPYFRDLTTRLKVYARELDVTDAQRAELADLKVRLDEGGYGITHRDSGRWLTKAIDRAQEKASRDDHVCVTPEIVLEVLQELLNEVAKDKGDPTLALRIAQIADVVSKDFLVRELEQDVLKAVGRKEGLADTAYDEIIEELVARANGTDVKEYYSRRRGKRVPVNLERLSGVERIYLELHKRNLHAGTLAVMLLGAQTVNADAASRANIQRDPALYAAVVEFYARHARQLVPLEAIMQHAHDGSGSRETQATFVVMREVMVGELGYCPHCLHSALDVTGSAQRAKKTGEPRTAQQ